MHEAVQKQCSRDMVELLLRSGASPFVENSSGFTALDYAILRKELHLVRRFEEFGPFRGYLMAKVSRGNMTNCCIVISRISAAKHCPSSTGSGTGGAAPCESFGCKYANIQCSWPDEQMAVTSFCVAFVGSTLGGLEEELFPSMGGNRSSISVPWFAWQRASDTAPAHIL